MHHSHTITIKPLSQKGKTTDLLSPPRNAPCFFFAPLLVYFFLALFDPDFPFLGQLEVRGPSGLEAVCSETVPGSIQGLMHCDGSGCMAPVWLSEHHVKAQRG